MTRASVRWTLLVTAVAMLGIALVGAFALSLVSTGLLEERHFVWLFWVNVSVAALLLLVLGLAATRLTQRLRRGVPVYFAAEARLLRRRWYWRDERVARISRQWRMSYQPLTANWRLTLGGLSQVHASMAEALAVISRVAGWRLAELSQLDADVDHYLEFSLQLDTTQLPRPMQIDLGGDWKLGVERTMELR